MKWPHLDLSPPQAPRSLGWRLLWLAGIWGASVAALGVVALAIRTMIGGH